MLGFRNQPRRETAPLVALAKPHGLKSTEPRARGPVGVTTPLLVCLLCMGTECCAVRLGLSSNVFRTHLVAQKHRFLKEDLVFLFQRRFGWALFINCRSQTPAAETAASFRFTVSLRATARRPPPSPGAWSEGGGPPRRHCGWGAGGWEADLSVGAGADPHGGAAGAGRAAPRAVGGLRPCLCETHSGSSPTSRTQRPLAAAPRLLRRVLRPGGPRGEPGSAVSWASGPFLSVRRLQGREALGPLLSGEVAPPALTDALGPSTLRPGTPRFRASRSRGLEGTRPWEPSGNSRGSDRAGGCPEPAGVCAGPGGSVPAVVSRGQRPRGPEVQACWAAGAGGTWHWGGRVGAL